MAMGRRRNANFMIRDEGSVSSSSLRRATTDSSTTKGNLLWHFIPSPSTLARRSIRDPTNMPMPNVVIFFVNLLAKKIDADRFKLSSGQDIDQLPDFIYASLRQQDGVAFSRAYVERKLSDIVEALVVHSARVPRVGIFARLCGLLPVSAPVYHPELCEIAVQLLSWICNEKRCSVAALLLHRAGTSEEKMLTHKSAWRTLSRLFYEGPASRAWSMAKYRSQCVEFGIEMPWPDDVKHKLEQELVNACRLSGSLVGRTFHLPAERDEVTVTVTSESGHVSNETVDLVDYGLSTDALLQLLIAAWLEEESRVRVALNAIIYQKEVRARRRLEKRLELQRRGLRLEELTNDERTALVRNWEECGKCPVHEVRYDGHVDDEHWPTGPLRWEAGMSAADYRTHAAEIRRFDALEKQRKRAVSHRSATLPHLTERLLDLPRAGLDALLQAVIADRGVTEWEVWEWNADWEFGGLCVDPATPFQSWRAYPPAAARGGEAQPPPPKAGPETGPETGVEGDESDAARPEHGGGEATARAVTAPSLSPLREASPRRAHTAGDATVAVGPTLRSEMLDLSCGRAEVLDDPSPLLDMLAGPSKGVEDVSLASNKLGAVAAKVFEAMSERGRGGGGGGGSSKSAPPSPPPLSLARGLTSLNISDNEVDSRSIVPLAEMLRTTLSLTRLDLSWNQLTEADARTLAAGLKANTTLEVLSLSMNSVGSIGCDHVAEALMHHPTITSLDLSFTRAGEHCCLRKPPPLAPPAAPAQRPTRPKSGKGKGKAKTGGRGAKTAAVAAATPTVYAPPVPTPGTLVRLIETNPSLTCLDLRGNMLGERGAHKLQEACAKVLAEAERGVELLVDPQPERTAAMTLEEYMRGFRAKHGLPLDPPPPTARKGKDKKKGKGGKKKGKGRKKKK